MKMRAALIFTICAIVLQPLFLSLLPEALAPNLVFCLLVVIASTMEEKEAAIPITVLMASSFFIDFFSNQYVGVVAISMVIVTLVIFSIRRYFDLNNPFFLLGIVLVSNVAFEIIYWIIYRIMGTPYGFAYMLKNLPAGILVNSIVMFAGLFFAARQLNRIRRESYFKKMKW